MRYVFSLLLAVACTGSAPDDTARETAAVTCEYDGVVYEVGESWDAGDCGNTCTCMEDGVEECTDIGCE